MFNEITKKGVLAALEQPDDDRQEDGRRAAGAPRARSAGRLQDQPAALGQGAPRPERRPRAVGRAEAGLRPRARDRGVRARGVLERHRAARRRRCRRSSTRKLAQEGRRERSRSATRPKSNAVLADLEAARRGSSSSVTTKERKKQRRAAVHHEQAAAGVALPGQEDDDDRAAAVRRRRAARRRTGRPHHLHANRLDARRPRGARPRCASTSATTYGAEYLPEKPNVYKTKADAQDAHEAIRPTSMQYDPETVRAHLTPDQYYLYQLIWNRFVASQMPPATFDETTVDIDAPRTTCSASRASVPKFAGWMAVYNQDAPASRADEPAARARTRRRRKTTTASERAAAARRRRRARRCAS